MSEYGFDGYEAELVESAVVRLQAELAIANTMADHFAEAYADSARALLRSEEIGWNRLSGSDVNQTDLQSAKDVAKKLEGYTESNPLLARGREIRNSYLFSAPYEVGTRKADTDISTQQTNIINTRKNQEAVFSLDALGIIEGERYTAGQAYVLFDRSTKEFQQIPFAEISDIIYNPNNSGEIWYVQRSWSATIINGNGDTEVKEWKEWYPCSRYDTPQGGYARAIRSVPVIDTRRMVVDRVGLRPGKNLGLPDSFTAAPWALAYSSYLSDGSKVLAALAEWAWVVKPKKQDPAQRAAATVRSERGAGGTLFTDMDVAPMPKGNAVDLATGRPLAAQVAAALGISIVLLLADPGQSGAYGTAQTLADPNRRTMEARREHNSHFLEECLALIGIKEPVVTWEKMAPGTDLEEMELTAMAWGTGLFSAEEVRPRVADLAHITIVSPTAPDGVMIPNNEKSLARPDVDADAATPGSTAANDMANGQGSDNLGIGNVSKSKVTKSPADATSE